MATQAKSAGEKTSPKLGTAGNDSIAREFDNIKKNLAKRSLHVKFDLDDTGYQPIEKIGIGAYGVVCSAIHRKTSDKVAIKKIPCVFDALAIAKRTYREIKILKHFKHDNIILIREILKPKENYHDFKDIYVVFDLMESDLHRIIYSEQPLTEEHIRYFLYQILRGLKYIHSANVVHRDLKPSNLLVNEDCHVRIGDFGMARGVNSQQEAPSHYMTQYVATRWYRAPEILLSMLEYGTAVDMWSVGCIFAEMLGRKHLFPGKDYLTQVRLVLGVLGTPSEAILKDCQSDVLKRIIRSLEHRQPMAWTTLFPKASKKALDLLGKMLVLNPAERITVDKSLKHPFLSKYHDPDDEPICVPSFEFDFEKELVHMNRDHLREVIYKEIMEFHQPRTPTLGFLACLRPVPKVDGSGEGCQSTSPAVASFKDQLQAMMATTSAAGGDKEAEAVSSAKHASNVAPSESPTATHFQALFKKPEVRPATKKSPVSVDTASLKLPTEVDVEMLSAQSTDGCKAMDTQTPCTPKGDKQEVDKDQKAPDTKKGKENKTISADTKALVKQALLSHRQRTESCGEDDKPRPVTAAQRQREREEKRKKKQEKKMKRIQDKKSVIPGPELSDADKELLVRWSSMQKKTDGHQPIQPKPPVSTTACAATSTVTVVCLPQGISVTASPPQGSTGASPSHPAPTSTPPTVLPAGILSQGQLTILTTAPCHGQIANGQNQIILQSGQIVGLNPVNFSRQAGSLKGPVNIQQGQTALNSQQGLQLSFPDMSVISLADLQRHPGGRLHISETQAEALKEALQVSSSQDTGKRESGGFEVTGSFQPYTTPPQTPPQLHRNNSSGHFVPGLEPSQSPQHETSSSPYYSQQSPHGIHSFSPSPESNKAGDAIFSQSPTQAHLSDMGIASQPPQNLSEFLARHCHNSPKIESDTNTADVKMFPETSFGGASASMNFFDSVGSSSGLFTTTRSKPEEAEFGAGQFSRLPQKHEGGFGEVKIASKIVPGPQHFMGASCQHAGGLADFGTLNENGVGFQGGGLSGLPFSSQQAGGAAGLHTSLPYFVPGEPGYVTSVHEDSMPFPVPAMGDGALPFSRYSQAQALEDLQIGRHQKARGAYGLPLHAHLMPPAYDSRSDMATARGSYGSPQADVVEAAVHSTLPLTSLSQLHHHHHAVPRSEQLGMSGSSFGVQQPAFQAVPSFLQYQSHQLHHHHHPQPQRQQQPHGQDQHHQQQQLVDQPHHQPGGQLQTSNQPQPEPSRQGPMGLRVSAPKPEVGGVDLVAMLSSKLSNIFPPSLSLTPRGTGAGYGVGMDLDILMADTVDPSSSRIFDMSPLSSSLLADWLDVTSNISQADLDALDHDFGMTSPMAMSYSEFSSSNANSNSTNNNSSNWG